MGIEIQPEDTVVAWPGAEDTRSAALASGRGLLERFCCLGQKVVIPSIIARIQEPGLHQTFAFLEGYSLA